MSQSRNRSGQRDETPKAPLGPSGLTECSIAIDRLRGRVDFVAGGRLLASCTAGKDRLWCARLVLRDQSRARRRVIFHQNGAFRKVEEGRAPLNEAVGPEVHGLEVERGPGRLDAATRERLLTRPRGTRPAEISHILRTFNGDSLRGRFLSLADDTLTFRARSRTLTVPLARVAEIVTLDEAPPRDPPGAAPFRVELAGGRRVSLETLHGADGDLEGRAVGIGHVVLPGASLVRLERGAGDRPPSRYDEWRLREPPALPVVTVPPAGEGGSAPRASRDAALGTEAADFELPALEGGTVSLGALRGKVLVVDFWATWCGPCVVALPALMKTVRRFEERGVVLLAINQRETREAVERFVERKGWDLRVLLDAGGRIGRAYGVEAIPRTVIIDRAGVIRHVHVGLSADLEKELGRELEALAGPPGGE